MIECVYAFRARLSEIESVMVMHWEMALVVNERASGGVCWCSCWSERVKKCVSSRNGQVGCALVVVVMSSESAM